MDNRSIEIITQSSAHDAAEITKAFVQAGHITDIQTAMQHFDFAHSAVLESNIIKIGENKVTEAFPGSQPQPAPGPGPAAVTGPQAAPGVQPLQAFPQATPAQPQALPAGEEPFPAAQGPAPVPVPASSLVHQGGPPPATPAPAAAPGSDDALWRDLFENFGEWYDNRLDKKSANGPDFKSKKIVDPKNPKYKAGLWLKDAPDWAKPNLGIA